MRDRIDTRGSRRGRPSIPRTVRNDTETIFYSPFAGSWILKNPGFPGELELGQVRGRKSTAGSGSIGRGRTRIGGIGVLTPPAPRRAVAVAGMCVPAGPAEGRLPADSPADWGSEQSIAPPPRDQARAPCWTLWTLFFPPSPPIAPFNPDFTSPTFSSPSVPIARFAQCRMTTRYRVECKLLP